MTKTQDGELITSTGKKVGWVSGQSTLSILHDGWLGSGYDSAYVGYNSETYDYDELTQEEKIEIAQYMVVQWRAWAGIGYK